MNKGFILFLILIFIFIGIYGAYFFLKLQNAEETINESIMNIKEGNYDEALNKLKIVLTNYNYKIVIAPTMFLIADTYERMGKYNNAIETHRMLISNNRLVGVGNWHIKSVISISKLYRNGLVETSKQQIESLEEYLRLIIEKIKVEMTLQEKTGIETIEMELRKILNSILNFNYDLAIKDASQRQLLTELETELGFVYLQEKKYNKAEEIFNKINTSSARFGLAQLYLETGDEAKGIVLLDQLILIDETGKMQKYYMKKSYEYAVKLYNEKKFSDAIRIFEGIIQQSVNTEYSELSLYSMANYYYSVNYSGPSLKYINQILSNSVKTKDEDAQLLKGYVYYDSREFLQALKAFRDFIKKYPHSDNIPTAREWESMCERSIKYLN